MCSKIYSAYGLFESGKKHEPDEEKERTQKKTSYHPRGCVKIK